MADNLFKGMWLVAALHNFIGGALFLIFANEVYGASNLDPPEPGIHYQTWIGLIFVFGIGYYFVFKDMYANRNLVILWILAKLVSATPMLVGLISHPDTFPKLLIIPIITDFIFAGLFLAFFVFATRTQRWRSYPT